MKIGIHVALQQEARIFIEHFKLKKTASSQFPIYQNENTSLVISGIGAFNASTAVGYLLGRAPIDLLINFGVAGHPTMPLGALACPSSISFNKLPTRYPYINPRLPLKAFHPLTTVTTPDSSYQQVTLYDMEGYGFFEAATKLLSLEKILMLKVISDNKENPLEGFDKKLTQELIQSARSEVFYWIQKVLELQKEHKKTAPLFLHSCFRLTTLLNHKKID